MWCFKSWATSPTPFSLHIIIFSFLYPPSGGAFYLDSISSYSYSGLQEMALVANRSPLLLRSRVGEILRAFISTSSVCKANGSKNGISSGKLYELRTYAIKPDTFGEFNKVMQECYALRTAHSKLIGYWSTELGGVNEVVHIWEYGEDGFCSSSYAAMQYAGTLDSFVHCYLTLQIAMPIELLFVRLLLKTRNGLRSASPRFSQCLPHR